MVTLKCSSTRSDFFPNSIETRIQGFYSCILNLYILRNKNPQLAAIASWFQRSLVFCSLVNQKENLISDENTFLYSFVKLKKFALTLVRESLFTSFRIDAR